MKMKLEILSSVNLMVNKQDSHHESKLFVRCRIGTSIPEFNTTDVDSSSNPEWNESVCVDFVKDGCAIVGLDQLSCFMKAQCLVFEVRKPRRGSLMSNIGLGSNSKLIGSGKIEWDDLLKSFRNVNSFEKDVPLSTPSCSNKVHIHSGDVPAVRIRVSFCSTNVQNNMQMSKGHMRRNKNQVVEKSASLDFGGRSCQGEFVLASRGSMRPYSSCAMEWGI